MASNTAEAAAAAAAPKQAAFRVGLVCGSQRVVRVGPQITDFIANIVKSELARGTSTEGEGEGKGGADISLELIDVAGLGLPLFDEPGVPAQITSADGYAHEHTRAWSRRIAALDAFVFVTPQYNWGVPAGLKNAIDYLFNEWKGKPALVVSYGGHGGDKAAASLATILGGGLSMRLVDQPVALAFPDRQTVAKATRGEDLHLSASKDDGRLWSDKHELVLQAWRQLVSLLLAVSA